jgi:putative hemolysin
MRGEVLELGRSCVHRKYRNTTVLHILWKGIREVRRKLCGALPDWLQFPVVSE